MIHVLVDSQQECAGQQRGVGGAGMCSILLGPSYPVKAAGAAAPIPAPGERAFPVDTHPFNTGCLPLSYSGNPGVNIVSYREALAQPPLPDQRQ